MDPSDDLLLAELAGGDPFDGSDVDLGVRALEGKSVRLQEFEGQ